MLHLILIIILLVIFADAIVYGLCFIAIAVVVSLVPAEVWAVAAWAIIIAVVACAGAVLYAYLNQPNPVKPMTSEFFTDRSK